MKKKTNQSNQKLKSTKTPPKSNKTKSKNQFVKTLDQLKDLCKQGIKDYAIIVAPRIGLYSRKTITFNKKTNKFNIHNHIDDSKQSLTEKQIMDDKITHIGTAMPKRSLVTLID